MDKLSRRALLAGGACAALSGHTWAASGLPVPQPGTRHVWAGGSATIPGARTQIEPDSNGQWINMATGQRFYEFDTPGAAGLGYVVTDITHATANGVVGQSVTLICPDGFSGPAKIVDSKYFLRDLADYWIDPRQLAAMGEGASSGSRIVRLTHAIGNSSFNAVRIQTRSGSGWTQTIYDLESGVLLSMGSTSKGGPVTTLGGQNNFQAGEGSTSISFSRLAGARVLNFPGLNEEFPQNLRGLQALHYRGQSTVKAPGLNDYVEPRNLSYDIFRNTGPYFEARVSINGAGSRDPTIHPAGPIGALWMNPQTLQKHKQRATLVTDPLTGVTVTAMGTWNSTVAFSAETRFSRSAYAYDAQNGLLMQSDYTDASEAMTFVKTYTFAGAQ